MKISYKIKDLKDGLRVLIFNKNSIEHIRKSNLTFWSILGFLFYFISNLLTKPLSFVITVTPPSLNILFAIVYIIIFTLVIHLIYSLLKAEEKLVNLVKLLGYAYYLSIFSLLSRLIQPPGTSIAVIVAIYFLFIVLFIFYHLYKIKMWKIILGYIIISLTMYIFTVFYAHLIIQLFGENSVNLLIG